MEGGDEGDVPDIDDFAQGPYEEQVQKHVPVSWRKSARLLLGLWMNVAEHLYTDQVMKITDRFVIVGARNLTWKYIYHAVKLAKSYDFDECYIDDVTGLNTNHKLKSLFEMEKREKENSAEYTRISEDYNWNLSEELLAMWDKKPTPEHARRLKDLAQLCDVPFGVAWANDYDMRMRKEIPYDGDDTITTAWGGEYLFFVVLDPKEPVGSNKFRFLWLNVGRKCAWGGCGRRNPPLRCGKCKEAKYCNREHQINDWNDKHQQICK